MLSKIVQQNNILRQLREKTLTILSLTQVPELYIILIFYYIIIT